MNNQNRIFATTQQDVQALLLAQNREKTAKTDGCAKNQKKVMENCRKNIILSLEGMMK